MQREKIGVYWAENEGYFRMKIVVLDGYTLNPGDLDWAGLQALGSCEIHDRTPRELIETRARGAAILLTNKTPLDRATLQRLPDLKYIGVLATGYNVVDVDAARERNVAVSNVPAYSTGSVAQMVFALLLALANNAAGHSESVRAGQWSSSPDFAYWVSPQVELAGLTLGIVGYGQIGRRVSAIARAFGMEVLVCSRRPVEGERNVALEDLFRKSDVITLHCPLTTETKHLVNAKRLALMKRTACLINTGRGGLVDEDALAAALNGGRIAGAGLDVLSTEPPSPGNPLLSARNCVITPHIAWATGAARRRLMRVVVENVRAFLAGKPQNLVN